MTVHHVRPLTTTPATYIIVKFNRNCNRNMCQKAQLPKALLPNVSCMRKIQWLLSSETAASIPWFLTNFGQPLWGAHELHLQTFRNLHGTSQTRKWYGRKQLRTETAGGCISGTQMASQTHAEATHAEAELLTYVGKGGRGVSPPIAKI